MKHGFAADVSTGFSDVGADGHPPQCCYGEPGRAGHPDEDGGLGEIPAQLFGTVELPDSSGQGQGERAGGEAQGRGGYEVYRQRQDADYISDFDREIKRLEGKKQK